MECMELTKAGNEWLRSKILFGLQELACHFVFITNNWHIPSQGNHGRMLPVMCSGTKSDSYEEGNSTEIQRFLSEMIVIIIKRISLYSISILNKIFKLEERKLRTSLKITKFRRSSLCRSVAGKFRRHLNFHIVRTLSSNWMSEVDISGEALC